MMRLNLPRTTILFSSFWLAVGACSAGGGDTGGGSRGGSNGKGTGGSGGGISISGGGPNLGIPDAGDPNANITNPKTCAEAESARSYVGCEFWPTIVANPVWLDFDPAVVIANGNDAEVKVTVEGPDNFKADAVIPAGGLETVILKWVAGPDGISGLKGPEFSKTNTSGGRLKNSARVDKGAYRVTSTLPVTAWQFNPLQYAKVCPRILPDGKECRSASNDASLLLPTTAMTGNYRIFAYAPKNEGDLWGTVPGGFSITATKDNTEVKVQLGPKCGAEPWPPTGALGLCVSAGPGVEAKNANDVYTFTMNAGDVVQLVGQWATEAQLKHADVSGSIVNANQPVQVVSFNAIAQLPDASVANADHMEETVLPAEVIGKKYIVVPPTTPNGNAVGHVVRIYGNVDNTKLTYPEGKPTGAPDTINAGDMVQIPPLPERSQSGPAEPCTNVPNKCMIDKPFIVEGDQPFAVNSYMVGGTFQMPGTDPTNSKGDPSMSQAVTPEQFRKEYTFLAPADYTDNFADILIPEGAEVTLDGAPLGGTREAIGNSGWSFVRAKLDNSKGGVHKLATTHDSGVGLQIAGFGFATSYYYPGGLNLKLISVPPKIDVR